MEEIKYITSKEAAEMLKISTRRVVSLCHEGKLSGAFQKGRGWKIPKESVMMYQNSTKSGLVKNSVLSCAVGNTSYIEIVKNSYYVDKTLSLIHI